MHYLQNVATHWKYYNPYIKVKTIYEHAKTNGPCADSRIPMIFIMATGQHSRKDQEGLLYAQGPLENGHAASIKRIVEKGDVLLVQNPRGERVIHSYKQLSTRKTFHTQGVAFTRFTEHGDFDELAENNLQIRGWDTDEHAKLQYSLYKIGGALHKLLEFRFYHSKEHSEAWEKTPVAKLTHENNYLNEAKNALQKIRNIASKLSDKEIEGVEKISLPSLEELHKMSFTQHKEINQSLYKHAEQYIPVLAKKRNDHLIAVLKETATRTDSDARPRHIYVLMPANHALETENNSADLNKVAQKFQADLKSLGVSYICSTSNKNTSGAWDLGAHYDGLALETRWS